MKKISFILLALLLAFGMVMVSCDNGSDDGSDDGGTDEPGIVALSLDTADGDVKALSVDAADANAMEVFFNVTEPVASGEMITISLTVSGLGDFKQVAIQSQADSFAWPADGSTAKVWSDTGIEDQTNLIAIITANDDYATHSFKLKLDNAVSGSLPASASVTINSISVNVIR